MNNRDKRATNLLSRLFAYSPRVGRDALEDYCTEALAWCLSQSPEFFTGFLALTGIPTLHNWAEPADVHTQVRFIGIRSDDIDESVGGRFDLVVESGVATPFVLVVESKVGSGFGRDQLQIYRDKLDAPDAFPGVPKKSRHLVTLTTIRHSSGLTDGNITWPDIFRALENTPHPDAPAVQELFRQFAAFLKEKGLSMLELKKTDDGTLTQWFEVKKLESQLTRIVERLRNQDEIKAIVGRRQVKQEGDEWIGVSGNNGFWAGFGLSKENKPELFMWVEITVPGDRRHWVERLALNMNAAFTSAKRHLKRYGDADSVNLGKLFEQNSRFVFTKSLTGSLDGDGETVFACLHEIAKQAIALGERVRNRNV